MFYYLYAVLHMLPLHLHHMYDSPVFEVPQGCTVKQYICLAASEIIPEWAEPQGDPM